MNMEIRTNYIIINNMIIMYDNVHYYDIVNYGDGAITESQYSYERSLR